MARNNHTKPEVEAPEKSEDVYTVLASEWCTAEWDACAPGRPGLANVLALIDRAARGLSGIDRILRADRQLRCYEENADDPRTVKALPGLLIGELEAGQTALIGMLEREMEHLREWLGEYPITEQVHGGAGHG